MDKLSKKRKKFAKFNFFTFCKFIFLSSIIITEAVAVAMVDSPRPGAKTQSIFGNNAPSTTSRSITIITSASSSSSGAAAPKQSSPVSSSTSRSNSGASSPVQMLVNKVTFYVCEMVSCDQPS